MKLRNPDDGCVHYSDLKELAKSPRHYRASVQRKRTVTRGMRVGTVAHAIVLGKRIGHEIVMWDGDRRSKAWKEFEAAHAGAEIVTANEAIEAQAMADAVHEHAGAMRILGGARYEVPLRWTDAGIECATRGVDVIAADGSYIADLKTTSTVEPRRWTAHAISMGLAGQLAFYDIACRANGIDPREHYLIGVEGAPAYDVVVLKLTPEMLEQGKKAVVLWLEKLRVAEDNDCWDGYAAEPVLLDLPPWMGAADDDELVDVDEGELAETGT